MTTMAGSNLFSKPPFHHYSQVQPNGEIRTREPACPVKLDNVQYGGTFDT
jgi:hypothetical protein